MIAVWCEKTVEYRAETESRDPVVLFDLESLGIDSACFLSEVQSSFNSLDWDYYDVRREQLALLQTTFPGSVDSELYRDFYTGKSSLSTVLSLLTLTNHPFSNELHCRLEAIRPYRRRTTSRFVLSTDGDRWDVERISNTAITQSVVSSDYRSLQRVFRETDVTVVEHPQFLRLLAALGDMVRQAEEAVSSMTVTCWQTGIVATSERSGTNSPEGIHQDGADFIVSALVAARSNISGGASRVFGPDKKTEVLNVVLNPGQGIFQADTGSTLWHDVTPIKVADPAEGEGIRNIFGFDIHVSERG